MAEAQAQAQASSLTKLKRGDCASIATASLKCQEVARLRGDTQACAPLIAEYRTCTAEARKAAAAARAAERQ